MDKVRHLLDNGPNMTDEQLAKAWAEMTQEEQEEYTDKFEEQSKELSNSAFSALEKARAEVGNKA